MKATLRKKVVLFGRSFTIAQILALAAFIGAGAWGAYSVLQAISRASITVKNAPIPPTLAFSAQSCTIQAGSGIASAPAWVGSPTYRLTCSFSEFDETTDARMGLNIQNNTAGGKSVSVAVVLPPGTACVLPSTVSAPTTLGSGASAGYEFKFRGEAGPTGTLSCAGSVLPDLDVQLNMSVIP